MPLTFSAERHEYRLDGRLLPSVTQVLRPCYDFAGIPPAILAHKRELGLRVHKAIEFDLDDDLDDSSIAAELWPYIAAWRLFRREREYEHRYSERRVAHRAFGYAGTLDLFGSCLREVRPGKPKRVFALIDLKNTVDVSPAVALQTAAYRESLALEDADAKTAHRMALQLKPDGTYEDHWFDSAKDFAVFLNFLAVHNWIASNP